MLTLDYDWLLDCGAGRAAQDVGRPVPLALAFAIGLYGFWWLVDAEAVANRATKRKRANADGKESTSAA